MEAAELNKPAGIRSEPAERPIFIVGCPRSGTTLLQCLIATQKGVVTFPETHFFEQAANNGFKVAMYNAGKLYYNGGGGVKDIDKAIEYLKLAIYHDYDPAIKFCRENNISL